MMKSSQPSTIGEDEDDECRLLIQTNPKIEDPRELETILVSSLRSMFGEFEPHSYGIKIIKTVDDDDDETSLSDFAVVCQMKSMTAVRSALTMVTPPSYLDSKIYRFDVIRVTKGGGLSFHN